MELSELSAVPLVFPGTSGYPLQRGVQAGLKVEF